MADDRYRNIADGVKWVDRKRVAKPIPGGVGLVIGTNINAEVTRAGKQLQLGVVLKVTQSACVADRPKGTMSKGEG
jgi:hypothetical protein